jgi:hypothetical protein
LEDLEVTVDINLKKLILLIPWNLGDYNIQNIKVFLGVSYCELLHFKTHENLTVFHFYWAFCKALGKYIWLNLNFRFISMNDVEIFCFKKNSNPSTSYPSGHILEYMMYYHKGQEKNKKG